MNRLDPHKSASGVKAILVRDPADWCRRPNSAPTSRAQTHHGAFTIIELLVVLLIMSILAAAAAPAFHQSLLYHRIESAARRLKQDLEHLRDTAKARSATFEFTLNGTAYSLDEDAVEALDHSGSYTVNLASSPYSVTTVANDFADGETITFDGYGGASADAEVVLGLGDESRTVHIAGETGQISISNP